jgi:hypothetical protein
MDYQFESILKGSIIAYLKLVFCNLPGKTEEIYKDAAQCSSGPSRDLNQVLA